MYLEQFGEDLVLPERPELDEANDLPFTIWSLSMGNLIEQKHMQQTMNVSLVIELGRLLTPDRYQIVDALQKLRILANLIITGKLRNG